MKTFIPETRTGAVLWCLVSLACAPSTPPASPAPRSDPALVAAAARADSVRRAFTAADVEFMTGMIGHHAQAIVISGWAPAHGASAEIQRLAERIVAAQQDEIRTMQRWLADRNQPVPAVGAAGEMHHHGHEALMPGMLTPEQMQQLAAARGPAFDRLFLALMIQHHNGALTMVETLFGSHGAAQEDVIFKFASDVSADQTTEVARMERMLAALQPETGGTR